MYHDFDNDGIDEIVVGFVHLGMYLNGYVFRWVKTESKTDAFFENTGGFASSYVPYIDGNTIITKAGLINPIEKKFVYKNKKLIMQE